MRGFQKLTPFNFSSDMIEAYQEEVVDDFYRQVIFSDSNQTFVYEPSKYLTTMKLNMIEILQKDEDEDETILFLIDSIPEIAAKKVSQERINEIRDDFEKNPMKYGRL